MKMALVIATKITINKQNVVVIFFIPLARNKGQNNKKGEKY